MIFVVETQEVIMEQVIEKLRHFKNKGMGIGEPEMNKGKIFFPIFDGSMNCYDSFVGNVFAESDDMMQCAEIRISVITEP